MVKNHSSTDAGRLAERRALEFLENKNLRLLGRNYRSAHGEIDLIMQDKETIVFIEVRSRKNTTFLDPLESIDQRKIHKIIKTSERYIQNRHIKAQAQFRFDVITLTGEDNDMEIDWIKGAFEA